MQFCPDYDIFHLTFTEEFSTHIPSLTLPSSSLLHCIGNDTNSEMEKGELTIQSHTLVHQMTMVSWKKLGNISTLEQMEKKDLSTTIRAYVDTNDFLHNNIQLLYHILLYCVYRFSSYVKFMWVNHFWQERKPGSLYQLLWFKHKENHCTLTSINLMLSKSWMVLTDSTSQLSGVIRFMVRSVSWGMSLKRPMGPLLKLFGRKQKNAFFDMWSLKQAVLNMSIIDMTTLTRRVA